MLVYTENHETTAQRAINTTYRGGGKPHREGIFWGWDTVSTFLQIQFGKCILNSLIFPEL